ncbi:unnamed protein product [Cuscuta epithymum]|nr:unnamed protein product [Cuscuta epithymum]
MDEQRRIACAEVERFKGDLKQQSNSSKSKMREFEEKISSLIKERDQMIKHRDSAVEEALLWRTELGKALERVVIMEGAVFRAEEKVRVTEAEAEARIKEAALREAAAVKEKQELLTSLTMLQSQLKRQHVSEAKQVFEEKAESCSSNNAVNNNLPETKHMDPSEENIDKACLSVSSAVARDIQATEPTIADVREVSSETEESSLDIPVQQEGPSPSHQP